MKKHNITVPEDMKQLPTFYGIPKMHKLIPKMRFIAASNRCTTKPLSKIITKCPKLLNQQHIKYCKQIEMRTGVNRMWVINNSENVIDKIQYYNNQSNDTHIKNINTYDFTTLYTNIPH